MLSSTSPYIASFGIDAERDALKDFSRQLSCWEIVIAPIVISVLKIVPGPTREVTADLPEASIMSLSKAPTVLEYSSPAKIIRQALPWEAQCLVVHSFAVKTRKIEEQKVRVRPFRNYS